ncbi:MAG: hypothetical protein GY719_22765 [bacterium]|nr:hypothetical protein [bacterium]
MSCTAQPDIPDPPMFVPAEAMSEVAGLAPSRTVTSAGEPSKKAVIKWAPVAY